jgi:Tol biopolymer transport system component
MDRDGTNIQQLTFTRADENFPMYSPDGKKIAFISRDELTELCIMNSDGKKRESIVISPNFVVDTMARQTDRILGYPVWSPDGDQIAFTAVNQIFVVSVDQHISRWVILPLIVMGCILMWGVRRIQSRIPGQ